MASKAELELVFGTGSAEVAEQRARQSTRVFVRSLDQLAMDSTRATGRRLSAYEAYKAYGFDKLLEVATDGSCVLATTADAAGVPLKVRREHLQLNPAAVAKRAGITSDEVVACEESRRLPIRTYESIGRALGLDERYVAVKRQPTGNERLAVRLRTLGLAEEILGATAVSALAEASWVASTQARLADVLGLGFFSHGITPSDNFGSPGYAAYNWGYRHAAEVRERLGLPREDPIPSMRQLVEETFCIPLIQSELGESIAGATVEVDGVRAIVVNLSGANRRAFVRRTTMAHELGHLLFDPRHRLDALCVDQYDDLQRPHDQLAADRVEQRANAFAVELLAPRDSVLALYQQKNDLFATMDHFGIGMTSAQHQIRNASNGGVVAPNIRWPHPESAEGQQLLAWEGVESFAIDYHPIPSVRHSRAGRFGAIAVRAAQERLVSWDTVAEWLETTETLARAAASDLRELYPSVWERSHPAA